MRTERQEALAASDSTPALRTGKRIFPFLQKHFAERIHGPSAAGP